MFSRFIIVRNGVPSHPRHFFRHLFPPFFILEGGDRSGASQPHKHLQFFPAENEDGPPIERLARAARIDKDGRSPSLSCDL